MGEKYEKALQKENCTNGLLACEQVFNIIIFQRRLKWKDW